MIIKHDLSVAPATEPITLTEAKSNLGIDDTLQDTEITRYIKVAREKVEKYLGVSLVTQTWKLTLDRFPTDIELKKTPVASVTSIKYYDSDNALQTLSSATYYLDNKGENARHWILEEADSNWPDTYSRVNAVEVLYVSGKADSAVDEDIQQAIHEIVKVLVTLSNPVDGITIPTKAIKWIMDDYLSDTRMLRI